MNKLSWKEVVRKTKWASRKKRLTKSELGELVKNMAALDRFMAQNKSNFGDVGRSDPLTRQHQIT